MKSLMTARELADQLKVTTAAISLWVKEGMPTYSTKPMRFIWGDVEIWIKKRG